MLFPHWAGEAVVEDVEPVGSAHSPLRTRKLYHLILTVIRITRKCDLTHGLPSVLRGTYGRTRVYGSCADEGCHEHRNRSRRAGGQGISPGPGSAERRPAPPPAPP